MQKKKFLATYGPLFLGFYIGGFIILVTFYSRLKFPTIWGDVLVSREGLTLYFPFASSFMLALLSVALIEMYRFMKRF